MRSSSGDYTAPRSPLFEEHGLGRVPFDEVTQHLRARGLAVRSGSSVDATIIAAPFSTKNATGTRDPGMHQTQKGGIQIARMEHVFTEMSTGTQEENSLIVPGGPLLAPLARFLLLRLMPADKEEAWLKHSVEEMGTLEHFLPELYAREAEGQHPAR